MCHCYEMLVQNKPFRHYKKEEDRLGSEFDDFLIMTYVDDKGNEIECYGHSHLGFIHSFFHPISTEKIPEGYKVKSSDKIEYSNHLIDKIRQYVIDNKLYEKNSLCPHIVKNEKCAINDCPYSHNKAEFICINDGNCTDEDCKYHHDNYNRRVRPSKSTILCRYAKTKQGCYNDKCLYKHN